MRQLIAQPVEALLVDAATCAGLSGTSVHGWWRLHAQAATPAHVKLGSKTLWNRSTVLFWIEANCPPRRILEAMLANARPRLAQFG